MQITDTKRLNAMIESLERQRNEAQNARVHAEANVALLQDALRAAQKEIASLKKAEPAPVETIATNAAGMTGDGPAASANGAQAAA